MEKFKKVLIFAEKMNQFGSLCSAAKSIAEETAAFSVAEAPNCPVDKAYVVDAQESTVFDDYFDTFAAVVAEYAPQAILFSSEKRMRALAARTAAVCKVPVVSDVSAMAIADGRLVCSHLVYGGAAVRREYSFNAAVVVMAPGAFDSTEGEAVSIVKVPFSAPAHPARFVEKREKQGETVNLSAVKRAVGIGRGLAKKEDLAMVYALAEKLGAEVGCSRPIAQGENWMDISRYIGVSGVILKPDIYVALGISGQVQHTVGVRDAKLIIAVNKDKNAPIFKQCDYGIVGDIYKVVPALTELL